MSKVADHFVVRRVQDNGGSHIEPPFNEKWDDLIALRWQAAVVEVDTGLRVRVSGGGHEVKRRGRWVSVSDSYSLQVGACSVGSFDFKSAWSFLSGVSVGAEVVSAEPGRDV